MEQERSIRNLSHSLVNMSQERVLGSLLLSGREHVCVQLGIRRWDKIHTSWHKLQMLSQSLLSLKASSMEEHRFIHSFIPSTDLHSCAPMLCQPLDRLWGHRLEFCSWDHPHTYTTVALLLSSRATWQVAEQPSAFVYVGNKNINLRLILSIKRLKP